MILVRQSQLPGTATFEQFATEAEADAYTATHPGYITASVNVDDPYVPPAFPTYEEMLPEGNHLTSQDVEVLAVDFKNSIRFAEDGSFGLQTDDGTDETLLALSGYNIVAGGKLGTFQGIKYNADYSADFVDWSLVNKSYVEGLVAGGIALSGTTFGNPLTGPIQIADGLDSNIIYQNVTVGAVDFTNSLLYSETGGKFGFSTDDGVDTTYIGLSGYSVQSGGKTGVFKGIEYDADYSAQFVARSLVDKAYVDAAAIIANDSVTNAKLANMTTATFKGRATAEAGDPEDLTATQATAMLNIFTSALKGLVPLSGGGTTKYLRADGTWVVPNLNVGNVSESSNSLTTPTTVSTYTILANSLVNNGDFLVSTVTGIFATNVNAKRIQIKLGATELFDTGIQIQNGGSRTFEIRLVKDGATQKNVISAKYSDGVTLFADITEYVATSEDMGVNKDLTVIATGVANGDITKKLMTVEF